LAADEAPACVQACPNQAIRISIVDQETVLAETETNQFLPGAPDPRYTIPTTVYKTSEPLPRGLLPADYFSSRCEHGHTPLVVMLVLTQMSVGAFVVEQAMFAYVSLFREEIAQPIRWLHLLTALMLGGLGLAASVFHLGRPQYAFRAWIGLRTSWLSREIVAFGLFAGTATIYVATACLDYVDSPVPIEIQVVLGVTAAVVGLLAVGCSVMVYVDTRRPFWSAGSTSVKFLLTALLLGISVVLIVSLLRAAVSSDLSAPEVMREYGQDLCRLLLVAAIAKMFIELSVFRHLRARQHRPLKRTALLMAGQLSITVMNRFFFGLIGGVVLPLVLIAETSLSAGTYHPLFVGILTVLILLSLSVGELLERHLFFVASVAPRMPGAVAA
jgi:DMSO reductase anchor subunit